MITRGFRGSVGVVCLVLGFAISGWGQSAAGPAAMGTSPLQQAVVPHLIKFSGRLQNLAGKAISGPVDVTFSLYSVETSGTALWFETQTVQADSLGNYTVLLGAMTPAGVPMELFEEGQARWLGVQVANLPEQPRVLLVSVPYAMKAADAETLGGKPASAFMLASQAGSDAAINAATAGTLSGLITSGGLNAATRTRITPQAITAGGTANYIAGWAADGTTLGTSAIFQDPTTDNIGIGTNAPTYTLDVNSNVIAVGTKTAFAGGGGSLRARDDTGTERWAVGIPGVAGSTDFFVANSVNGHAPLYIQASAPSYGLYLHASGRVGMGTTAPAFPLDVNGIAIGVGTQTPKPGYGGSVRFRDDTGSPRWAVGVPGSAGATGFAVFDTVSSRTPIFVESGGPSYGLYLNSSGNLGIGTASPTAKLEVKGNAKFNGTMTATKFVGDGSGLTGIAIGGVASLGANTFTGTQNISFGNFTLDKGNINLPQTTGPTAGVIYMAGLPFIHACCAINYNIFAGPYAGNLTATGGFNSAFGAYALAKLQTGTRNTVSGG